MYDMICVCRIQNVYTSVVYIELTVFIIPHLLLYYMYTYTYTLTYRTLQYYTYLYYTPIHIQKLNHCSNLGKTFLAMDSASILTGNTTTATGVGSGIRKSISSRESAMNNMRHSYFYSTDNYTNKTSPRGVDDLTITGGGFQ